MLYLFPCQPHHKYKLEQKITELCRPSISCTLLNFSFSSGLPITVAACQPQNMSAVAEHLEGALYLAIV